MPDALTTPSELSLAELPLADLSLADLRKGQRAVVIALDEAGVVTPLPPGELERRLIEMGVLEGAQLEIMHEGFPGADPIAVRVDEHVLALRRNEARAVRVTPLAPRR
ncbi:MAG: FeoA family protein [Acetobacteraceae bacterium]|nr:FeoA family protein [Acetobacteraceae bacterium]